MVEKKFYIAEDGAEFHEDDYGSAEKAKVACEEHEKTKSAIKAALATTIVLLDSKGQRTTDLTSAFAIRCKTDEAARLLAILGDEIGCCTPWDTNRLGAKAGYYSYDRRRDEWFDLSAKITELTTIKKNLEEA